MLIALHAVLTLLPLLVSQQKGPQQKGPQQKGSQQKGSQQKGSQQKVVSQGKNDGAIAFLKEVGKTLRNDKTPDSVSSFTARVRVLVNSKQLNADVEATIQYLAPSSLKTIVKEGDEVIVRGKPRKGTPWMQSQGRAYKLEGKDRADDRRNVYRDLAIASAMTRYLYPDRQLLRLASLTGPTEVTGFRMTRTGPKRTVQVIRGVAKDSSDYPLALSPKHRGPVRVTVLFDKATRYPLVIELQPLDDMKSRRQSGPREELRFLTHKKYDSLVLPGSIMFRGERKGGKLGMIQKVSLLAFDVNPHLKPEQFAMPAPR